MLQSESQQYTRIHIFDSLQIHRGDIPLTLKGEKPRSLLAYLILHPRIAHRREMLADLLWPDAEPERVRRNLSDVLYRLQKEIEPEWLMVDAESIALVRNTNLWVDVWEFDRLIASQDVIELGRAVELYSGDLLAEFYDDWVLAERELRRAQYLSALEMLTNKLEGEGKLQDALLLARRLILAEPLHEPAHQAYLRLLGRLRRFGEAFAHFDYLCELLRSELDSKPVTETSSIIEALVRERDLEGVSPPMEETRPFIGRKMERAAALTVVEAMFNGNGSLLSIEGGAGIGKSRLLREVAAGARWRGATVLYGQASETPSASPHAPLIDALSPLLDGPRGNQFVTMIAAETLSLLAPLHSEWGVTRRPDDVPVDQARKRFYNALNLFGETLAQLAHVVLILDDMHWADTVMWECLRALAKGFVERGGLIIISYRRPEIETKTGWELIQGWDRDGILKTISLSPFSVDEVAQYIGEIPDADPVEVHAWAGGNPFFINEWLAEPASNLRARHTSISLRLENLSPNARSALESASVLGGSLPYRLWSEISELTSPILAGLCDDLTVHHWLQPSTAGYEFTHDLIRSAIYGQIEPTRRRTLHERTARAYLTFDPDNLRARAFHLDHAGLAEDAAKAYRLAGEEDLARFAFGEAQRALERALTLMSVAPTIERVEIALALAQACHATGDRVRQKSALDEALAGTSASDTYRLQTLLAAVQFATPIGQFTEVESQLEAALALARDLHDDARETEAIILFGNLAAELGKWSDAHKWSLQALEHSRATGNLSAEGRALRFIGIVTRSIGRHEESIQWLEKAITVHRALEDRFQTSITQTNLLASFNELGAWDRLIEIAQDVVLYREKLGDYAGAAYARHNRSLAYYALGEYVTARQIIERVIQDSEAAQIHRVAGLARNVLGLVAEAEGKFEEALHLYRTALTDAEAVKAATEAAYAKHDLGALLTHLGQPAEAISYLESAHAAWVEQGNLLLQVKSNAHLGLAVLAAGDQTRARELAAGGWDVFQAGVPAGEQPQDWLWALYRLMIALDQTEHTPDVLRAAYAELQRQAKNISDLNFRRSFFENVPLNRDIVRAFDQLTSSPRVISISLARKDAPLGRSLRQDDFVAVQWTVNAPEDEAIPDKTKRRQFQLIRLLEQATAQNAAPTDEDLARALGVSRRTILRDMKQLAQEIPQPPTRKRKK